MTPQIRIDLLVKQVPTTGSLRVDPESKQLLRGDVVVNAFEPPACCWPITRGTTSIGPRRTHRRWRRRSSAVTP